MANKGPNEPALPEIRERLDLLDREILERLAERQRLVLEVAADKRRRGIAIRDVEREREVLASRRTDADALGFPGNIAESIWRLIMLASREQQSAQQPKPEAESERKTIAIVGGEGQMGELLARFFGEHGHEILIVDKETPLTAAQAAARADVVIVSVPIRETERVIREVGPHMRSDALLMDITSLKAAPVRAMLESTEASVIGTHPMFGPGVRAFEGQRVVLCVGRDREGSPWLDWLKRHLRARGLFVSETDAEHHDRVMSIVQVLLHYQTQVLGLTLANTGMPLEESLAFTSPAYLLEAYVAARHFAQDSALYGPIEMENPASREIVDAFRAAAAEIGEILAEGDQVRFDAMFEKVRAYFGEFTSEALEQSGFLIDRLIELTTGRAAAQS
jgi:chorismate mutase / prephenate dehydrogenase